MNYKEVRQKKNEIAEGEYNTLTTEQAKFIAKMLKSTRFTKHSPESTKRLQRMLFYGTYTSADQRRMNSHIIRRYLSYSK